MYQTPSFTLFDHTDVHLDIGDLPLHAPPQNSQGNLRMIASEDRVLPFSPPLFIPPISDKEPEAKSHTGINGIH